MPLNRLYVLLFLSLGFFSRSQVFLRVNYQSFGFHQKHDYHIGDRFKYKRVGSSYWGTQTIANLRDSVVYFNDDYGIRLDEIKKIRVDHRTYHNKLLQRLMLYGGVGYPLIVIANNLMAGNAPVLPQPAVILTLSFWATRFIINECGIRRVKVNDKNFLKIMELDFEHLNTP